MHARGGKTENHIAGFGLRLQDQVLALGRTNGESGKIEIAVRIHARHFRGLATDQGGSGLAAAFGDPGNNRAGRFDIELAGGVVIEEEQRLGALHDQIVHAHGNEVRANAGIVSGIDREAELGADAIGRGDENRILETGGFRIEDTTKAANGAIGARPDRGLGQGLDEFDQLVRRINVNARFLVGKGAVGSIGS
tara:strand:- start:1467 stop:2048 length:582 start_codon:yes stop_codon:yes gene_type:complete